MNEASGGISIHICGGGGRGSGWNVMTVFEDAKWITETGKRMSMEDSFMDGEVL
jgi:hypothetical protein